MSFHSRVLAILQNLQDIGGLLIKRGSVMGPLVPSLLLIPVFLFAAWLFRSTFVISDCPIISTVLVIGVLGIVFSYHRHYASFAKNDPDRLQSEKYRYETARMEMMIAAQDLNHPVPVEELPLEEPRENLAALEASSEQDEPAAPTDEDEEKAS